MGNKHNELYEAPTISVVEMKQEGVICESGSGSLQDYNWNNPVDE